VQACSQGVFEDVRTNPLVA